ncbi:LysM peptidoglycan-binding domain-containing protein [Wukongibacter baidiensis]|uniref:LysM peptidoglycan-binding domain-containing protein n=1 Tax=Wukongibacter baidiensis TaxID=1723361 RepID=UPI003D7F352B
MYDPLYRRCPGGSIPYMIRPGDSFYEIARKLSIDIELLYDLNPMVDPLNLAVGDVICIPVQCKNGQYYYIQPGDTLYALAEKYNTTVRDILIANPMIDPYRLFIGQIICIPEKEIRCPEGFTYEVQVGDYYWKIATKYNFSYEEFKKANKNYNDILTPGQTICIPLKDAYDNCNTGKTYVIEEGDTLTSIAENFVVGVGDLLTYNPKLTPCDFVPGVKICIPPEVQV